MERQRTDVLASLRADYWEGVTGCGDDEYTAPSSQYLVFRVFERAFAFETIFCRQVLRVPEIVPLPGVPPHVAGVINMRGRVVSVTSLGGLLDPKSSLPVGSEERLIVVGDGHVTTAVLVDTVEAIIDVRQDSVQQPGGGSVGAEFAVGEILEEGRLVMLLAVSRILSDPLMVVDYRRDDVR